MVVTEICVWHCDRCVIVWTDGPQFVWNAHAKQKLLCKQTVDKQRYHMTTSELLIW